MTEDEMRDAIEEKIEATLTNSGVDFWRECDVVPDIYDAIAPLLAAEVAAREAAAWRAAVEAAAAWHDAQAAQAQGFADAHVSQFDHEAWQGCADQHRDSAEDIRALQPPADLAAAAATVDDILDAAENVCIARSMNWDMDGALGTLEEAIRARGRAGA